MNQMEPREPCSFSCFDDFDNDGYGRGIDWEEQRARRPYEIEENEVETDFETNVRKKHERRKHRFKEKKSSVIC